METSNAEEASNANKKYELLENDTIKGPEGETLYRIRALRNIWIHEREFRPSTDPESAYRSIRTVSVIAGTLGGYVQSEKNLSQGDDGAWIFDQAKAYGNAEVSGNALLKDTASASGNAQISYFAQVQNNGSVSGDAAISDYGRVLDSAVVSGNAVVTGKVMGEAKIGGTAKIFRDMTVGGDAEINSGTYRSGSVMEKTSSIESILNQPTILSISSKTPTAAESQSLSLTPSVKQPTIEI